MKSFRIFLAVLLVTAFVSCNDAVSLSPSVHGRVYDAASGHSLEGVHVAIGTHTSTTTGDGLYFVQDVTKGSRTITATKSGYVDYTATVNVDDTFTEKNFSMQKR